MCRNVSGKHNDDVTGEFKELFGTNYVVTGISSLLSHIRLLLFVFSPTFSYPVKTVFKSKCSKEDKIDEIGV